MPPALFPVMRRSEGRCWAIARLAAFMLLGSITVDGAPSFWLKADPSSFKDIVERVSANAEGLFDQGVTVELAPGNYGSEQCSVSLSSTGIKGTGVTLQGPAAGAGPAVFACGQQHFMSVQGASDAILSVQFKFVLGSELVVADAHSANNGGALTAKYAQLDLAYCSFTQSSTKLYGGAISLEIGANADCNHCNLTANLANEGGGAVFLDPPVVNYIR